MPIDDLPRLGLGTANNSDPRRCADTVATALELGYRHVDTAENYGNEAAVGRGIAEADVPRDEVFLATKTVHVDDPGPGYGDVIDAVEGCLDRLRVGYLDLLYVHWPSRMYDPPVTLAAFDDLRDDGVIDHVGLSNFTPPLLDEARAALDAPIAAHQVELHPLLHQEDLVAYAREHDHWLVAYSPLAKGRALEVDAVRDIAVERGVTPARVCLAWLLSKPTVAAIPKATGEAHLRDNLAALDCQLDPAAIERIDAIDREHRVVDRPYAPWNP